ncbi:unnamed protein product, partial [Arabidopsis halleri]
NRKPFFRHLSTKTQFSFTVVEPVIKKLKEEVNFFKVNNRRCNILCH